ncbi:MAG: hypothetical protein L0241_20910 [Planctomycetia bacterium]|nr:hypothetical protein [Planctomycetia bacterium]
MIIHSVTWTLAAIQQLAALVANATDPVSVRQAGAWVDYTLRRIPLNVGESRRPGYRTWYADVLGVYYHLDEDAYRVRVISIGPARRH